MNESTLWYDVVMSDGATYDDISIGAEEHARVLVSHRKYLSKADNHIRKTRALNAQFRDNL